MFEVAPARQSNPRRRRKSNEAGPTEKEREYLEIIYYLAQRNETVIAARLARWMGVQPPTVTHVLTQLEDRKGYIARNARGEITLTATGFAVAEQVVRRHRLLECFLLDVLHVPWYQIHEEAVRLEHALSPMMMERIEALVGNAMTCPHGNAIPLAEGGMPDLPTLQCLTDVGAEVFFNVQQVLEEAEENIELMRYLQSNNLIPGRQFVIIDSSPSYGVTLRSCNHDITLSPEIAAALWGTTQPIGG